MERAPQTLHSSVPLQDSGGLRGSVRQQGQDLDRKTGEARQWSRFRHLSLHLAVHPRHYMW